MCIVIINRVLCRAYRSWGAMISTRVRECGGEEKSERVKSHLFQFSRFFDRIRANGV